MRICATRGRSRPPEDSRTWSDLADLLDEIRSPQRDEVRDAIHAVCGDEIGPSTIGLIAESVMDLYRRRHAQD